MRSIGLILVLVLGACNSTLDRFKPAAPDGGTGDVGLVENCPGGIGLTLDPEEAHFGLVPLGETATERVTVINESMCALQIRAYVDPYTPAFAIVSSTVAEGVLVEPGDAFEADVQFSPTQPARYDSELGYLTEPEALARIELAADGLDLNTADLVCQSRELIRATLGVCIQRELECFNGRDTEVTIENIVALPPPTSLLSVSSIPLPLAIPADSAFFFSVELCGGDVGPSQAMTTVELIIDEGANTSTVTVELELIVH